MKFRILKIDKYEPENSEKILAAHAAKGEFIKSWGAGIACFKTAEPNDKVRYCIEASMYRPSRKKRAEYAEFGWKLACRSSDFNVYISEDENAVPVHTDRSEYAHVIEKFHRSARNILIFTLILAILSVISPPFFFSFYGMEPLVLMTSYFDKQLSEELLFIFGISFVVELPILLLYLNDYIEAGKFVAGSIENSRFAEKAVRSNRIMKLVFVLWIVIWALNMLANAAIYKYTSEEPQLLQGVPEKAFTLQDIFYDERIEYLTTDEKAEKYLSLEDYPAPAQRKGFSTQTKVNSSIVGETSDYWQTGAYFEEGEEYGKRISFHGQYIELRTEWLAERTFYEMSDYDINFWLDGGELVELDTADTPFDMAGYSSNNKSTYIILRQGNVIHSLTISFLQNDKLSPEQILENLSVTAN